MKVLSADDLARRACDWPSLIDAADRGLHALASGSCEAPVRTALALSGGDLLTMPGRLDGADRVIVKLVTVVPDNARRGRPTIQGVAVIFDARTGEPVAVFDGAMLTLIRTAAVSAAAARRLADANAHVLALLGSGAQAPWHARALASVLALEEIRIWSPTEEHRERLARQLTDELGIDARAVRAADEATRGAEVVCCATTAHEAFLERDMLTEPSVCVIAIGAFRPDMAEIGLSIFREAARVFVDDVEAVRHEGGDVIAAIERGAIRSDHVVPVGAAKPRVDSCAGGGLAVFKSVGSAVEDAAVAEALLTGSELTACS